MTRRLAEFPLQEGGTVLVEVADVDAGARGEGEVTRGWGQRRVVEQAQETFEQAVGQVQPAVQAVIRQLRALADAPEEIQVEFGIELSAEAGAFVAGVSSTGNFRVTMTWRSGSTPDTP